MSTLVLAEKPSVARDLAAVLGARGKRNGYLEGNGFRVTWAIGHLVGLPEPHEIDPAWKAWRAHLLPMMPSEFPLVVLEDGKSQFDVVAALLNDEETERIVAATDAGREGELIFRYIHERSGCKKPWKRLWISSLTEDAIRNAWKKLEDGKKYDGLGDAARARSRADWLVGMNLSRAYSITHDDLFSVGRVQTPTLAMVVERDRAIRAFVPEPYLEVEATFDAPRGRYLGTWHRFAEGSVRRKDGKLKLPKAEAAKLPADGVEAAAIVERVRTGHADVLAVERSLERTAPPLLYDLTELQRHANRLYGITAKATLDAAQALYERHKALSYPRTDSRHLSTDIAATLPEVVPEVASLYPGLVAAGSGTRPLGKRFVDDAKVGDHHAIIPTGQIPRLAEGSDEARIYDLVCRRLLMAWHEDRVEAVTTVVTRVTSPDAEDRFLTRGTALEQAGWSALEPRRRAKKEEGDEPTVAAGLEDGLLVAVSGAETKNKETKPPRHFTEATLLTAMETAGRTIDEKALSEAMRDTGLGTPATRAAVVETLLGRKYLVREGKNLVSTEKGDRLVTVVHPHAKSAAMTGDWELRLRRMEKGDEGFDAFMGGIETYVREVVGSVLGGGGGGAPVHERQSARPAAPPPRAPSPASRSEAPAFEALPQVASVAVRSAQSAPVTQPRDALPRVAPPKGSLTELLATRFGFGAFRSHQEEICRAVTDGTDALVVMPTGAGKSLCYQLPGLARGGTTLVISPLIALIDDQVAKLRAFGMRAERIHSGLDRMASRAVCADYLRGGLDYLFIAPERLGVTGFPEMLAKRRPSLIAIDEAHCISQWGHDFRPDYRMLKERLSLLRPTPIVALTATATSRVQEDIVHELSLSGETRFIFGFRRHNIAIEVADVPQKERADVTRTLLEGPGRLPAIVYAPTRKEAERITDTIRRKLRVETYHAGMNGEQRARVQTAFLDGALDVIVATVAFGMGIDKSDVRTVVHSALPGSVEGYYQEIGRAGRDGAPSRAFLLHGFADLRTHTFFLERDYPEPDEVKKLYAMLSEEPKPRESLAARYRGDEDVFDKVLEKLWVHGGCIIDGDDVRIGKKSWKASYEAQRDHKKAQLDAMQRFAESSSCRMRSLVRHFGDREGAEAPCGICDVCAPTSVVLSRARNALPAEVSVVQSMLEQLRRRDGISVGRLFDDIDAGSFDRRELEALLASAARGGLVSVEDERFTREGRTINYRAVRLLDEARDEIEDETVLARLRVREMAGAATAAAKKGRVRKPRPTRAERPSDVAPRGARVARREPSVTSMGPSKLVDALKAWRLTEARRMGVPAFLVLTDKQLAAVASEAPTSEGTLRDLTGLGDKKVRKFGDAILRVVRDASR